MAWNPQLKTILTSKIADNLLAYIAANQVAAILWASGSALRTLQQFSDSVANRANPVFPSIAFASDKNAQDLTEDMIGGAYSVVFEVLTQSDVPSTAVSQARSYEKAIISMIVNCPHASLAANTGATKIVLQMIETDFEEIKSNEQQNSFMQSFQIRATYTAVAGAL